MALKNANGRRLHRKDPDGPPPGGSRPGAGRKTTDEELIRLLRRVDSFRQTDLQGSTKEFVAKMHEELITILKNPGRHAGTQASIIKTLLEEMTGKLPENLNIKGEGKVVVEIVESPRSKPATAEAAPSESPGPTGQAHGAALPIDTEKK